MSKVGPASASANAWDLPATAPATAGPQDPVEQLRDQLTDALAKKDPNAVATSLTVEQRPYAGNQLVINWIVSTSPHDTTAPARVRVDIIELLRVVGTSSLSYGSVLLIAQGAVRNERGYGTDTQVVRAKYSRELVKRTDFAAVAPGRILSMPDDKPAEIHPAYH
jgi:hypothetical protein